MNSVVTPACESGSRTLWKNCTGFVLLTCVVLASLLGTARNIRWNRKAVAVSVTSGTDRLVQSLSTFRLVMIPKAGMTCILIGSTSAMKTV